MNKILLSFFLSAVVISCTEIKQTSDTIKEADSLFKSANEGIKTLDSISKIVTDSAQFKKVIVPEIEKQKKSVESVIRENAKNLDSINAVIKKTTERINKSTDVIKTVDSASKVLKESNNPIDMLSTISKTLEKVSKQTKSSTATETQPAPEVKETEPQIVTPDVTNQESSEPKQEETNYTIDPMVKTAVIKVSVENLSDARQNLAMNLRNYGADIVTESFGDDAGYRNQYFTVKVPTRYFDQVANSVSGLGTLRTKSISSEGKDYDPNQMSDLEITLTENIKSTSNEIITAPDSSNNQTYKDKSSDAFMKGFDGLKNVFLFLLPFWPLLLIGGIVYYFYRKSKLKRDKAMNEALVEEKLQQQKRYRETTTETSDYNPETNQKSSGNDEQDYSKYMPKK